MKLCSTHQHDLVRAVERKGMGHYVSKSAGEATLKARRWLQGTACAQEFDPFVVSVLEINKKVSEQLGDVRGACPLCAVQHYMGSAADAEWIDNVTDLMVVTCQTNGLTRS